MKTTEEKQIIDIEVVNRPLTTKEKQSFSEFLKARRIRKIRKFTKGGTTIQHTM
jgi:hypothetical protein